VILSEFREDIWYW